MSNDIWSTEDPNENANVPKALRDHVKNLEKQLKDLTADLEKAKDQNAELARARNQATLETLLKDIPPRVTKWMKRDFDADKTEPSKEAVEKWLAENGEDFGYKPGEPEKPAPQPDGQQASPEVPPEIQAAYQAIQAFNEGQTGDTSQIEQRLAELGKQDLSFQEMVAGLRDMGAPLTAYGAQ